MHIHSVIFLAGSISNLGGLIHLPYVPKVISYSVGIGLLVYVWLALRHAYGASILRATLSAAFTLFTYFIFVMLTLMAIVLPVVVSRS